MPLYEHTVIARPDLSAQQAQALADTFGETLSAQGGTVDDLRRIFGDGVARVLPSTSRELLREGPDRLGDAADRLNDRLRQLGA